MTHRSQVDNYHLQGKLLYHLGKFCVPNNERIHVIREAHTSLVSSHFCVGKNLCHLQMLCYWPQMKNIVTLYVKGCVLCSVCNPSNRKLGLYTPLVSSFPWESASMDIVGSLPLSRRGHDYFHVVLDQFIKNVCINAL